jgi:Protein of unknown function (DUF4058)
MRPQFAGMNPWLEHPTLWPDVHNSLIGRARYDLVIDYGQPPQPPLPAEKASWAAAIIAQSTNQTPESTAQEPTP